MFMKLDLNKDTWVTAEGRRFKAEEMENGHLLNTILFLERNSEKIKRNYDVSLLDLEDSNLTDMMKLITGKDVSDKEVIKALWEVDSKVWVRQTKMYKCLINEAEERELLEFLEILREKESVMEEK